jgi:hypothetical protein
VKKRQKIVFFPILGGGRAPGAPPSGSAPDIVNGKRSVGDTGKKNICIKGIYMWHLRMFKIMLHIGVN